MQRTKIAQTISILISTLFILQIVSLALSSTVSPSDPLDGAVEETRIPAARTLEGPGEIKHDETEVMQRQQQQQPIKRKQHKRQQHRERDGKKRANRQTAPQPRGFRPKAPGLARSASGASQSSPTMLSLFPQHSEYLASERIWSRPNRFANAADLNIMPANWLDLSAASKLKQRETETLNGEQRERTKKRLTLKKNHRNATGNASQLDNKKTIEFLPTKTAAATTTERRQELDLNQMAAGEIKRKRT